MKNRKLKVAMVVVDGNDVSGEHRKHCAYPSPSVHPAIQAMLDGLGNMEEIQCKVFFGATTPCNAIQGDLPSLSWQPVPYKPAPVPGMGAALLGRFLALRRAIRAWKPDVVHGQGTEREAGLVAAFSGFPSVLTLHGNFREIEKIYQAKPMNYYWVAARLETLVLRRISHVICISRYVRDLIANFPCEKTVIPNPVMSSFLTVKRPPRSSPPTVICMGTIDKRKNTLQILEACELLWSRGMSFTLSVYGSPGYGENYAATFMNRLKPWQQRGKAVYEGFTTHPETVLAAGDIMVSASIEESFGMNLLEAMATGTPCIAPNLGGMRDIVADGSTGFTYMPDDLNDLTDKLYKLLTGSVEWQRMSEASRNRARDFFAPHRIACDTVAVYKNIMGQTQHHFRR